MRWLDGITSLMDMSLSKLQELVMDRVLQSVGSQRDTTERLHFHFSLSCIGEGNGLGPPAPAQPRLLGHEVMGLDAMILGFCQNNSIEVGWLLEIAPKIPRGHPQGIILQGLLML